MAWNPESTDALTQAIDVSNIEESSMKLWQEFLAGYFDGGNHFGIQFPVASLSFQNANVPQPLDGLNIHVLAASSMKARILPMPQGFTAYQRMTWTFYVRANVKSARGDGNNSQSLARWGSDSLYYLLNADNQLLPLHRAGVLQIRPSTARLVPSMDYAMRALDCGGTLNFLTRSAPILEASDGAIITV